MNLIRLRSTAKAVAGVGLGHPAELPRQPPGDAAVSTAEQLGDHHQYQETCSATNSAHRRAAPDLAPTRPVLHAEARQANEEICRSCSWRTAGSCSSARRPPGRRSSSPGEEEQQAGDDAGGQDRDIALAPARRHGGESSSMKPMWPTLDMDVVVEGRSRRTRRSW